MVEPEQKSNSPYKDMRASSKDNVMHLVEQRGCAVLWIASPRCNHCCWHLLPTTETFCTCNPKKKKNQQNCAKWCNSMIMPARTLLIWQTLYRSWVVKSFCTWSCALDFHLFRSLSNNLQRTSFLDENVIRTWLEDFFSSKPRDFYRHGIEKLLQRWQTVLNSEGEYIVDD